MSDVSPEHAPPERHGMTAPLNEHETTVAVDVMPDGSYAVGIHYGPDHSIALSNLQAHTYVNRLYQVASAAEYAAAVVAQLTTLGLGDDKALPTVGDLLTEMGAATLLAADVRALPVITATDRNPCVRFDLNDKPFVNVTAAAARDHAAAVHHAAATMRLDTRYYAYLRGPLDLPEERARAFIGDLARHRIE